MKKEVLANFDMTWLTAIACVLFLSVFLGMVYYTFKASKKSVDKNSNLPFDEGIREQ